MAAINALFLSIFFIILGRAQSQNRVTPEAPAPASDSCNGIFISYSYDGGRRLPPNRPSDRARQPYRFQSSFTVLNNDAEDLKSWRVFVGFQHDEYLVSATNAVLADGSAMPGPVGNGSLFAGFPNPDLATAIETAGDSTQMSARVELVGTQFGVGPPNVPMPANISLVNDGWICPRPTMRGNGTMQVCCVRDANATPNTTLGDEFLPRRDGDLTIMYDVTQTYPSDYWAQVTIENHNPLGRLDNWRLSWDWMEDEFIFAMRGAYPSVVDTSDCIFGRQGQFYRDLDFSTALNCRRRPTIVDLPLSMTNDTALGMIPFCCRNGTILPPEMDPSRSRSSFRLHVFKMPPNVNRSDLTPPQNWAIQGRLNPDYVCGAPVRVTPSIFADSGTRLPGTTAVASWQVVCNITAQARNTSPRCCVSFSAYYNESVVPCRTCACGCPASSARTCSSTGPALLLPSEALLVPFDNRSALAAAWARLHRLPLPAPAPCGDHCGVSINWHLLTDYRSGWSARVTLFNWDDDAFPDWFTAVELDRAGPGYEAAYSFNGTSMSLGGHGANDTVFMQGLSGLNYLVGETDGEGRSSGLRVPGKQQSVISFTKRRTPGINVPGGDGFPDRVYFNGEECSLPEIIPTSGAGGRVGSWRLVGVLFLAWLVFSW